MKNWRTTAAGITGAVAGFVAFSPHWFHPLVVDVAKYIMIGGLAAVGILGKDAQHVEPVPEKERSANA